MGGGQSKAQILNETINNIATNVVVENASQTSSVIEQVQKFRIRGVQSSTISDVRLLQKAEVSVKSIQDAVANTNLQGKLIADIASAIEKKKSDFDLSGKSESEIKNIVKYNVNSSFSTKTLSKLELNIKQKQDVAITDVDESDIRDIVFEQQSKGIGEHINKMSNSIVNELSVGTKLESITKEETKPLLVGAIDAVGNAFTNVIGGVGDIFGLDDTTVIMIGLILIISIIVAIMPTQDIYQQDQQDQPIISQKVPIKQT